MNREKFISICKYFGLILLGNILYAFGIMVFIEPHNLITGGITGVSLFLHYQLGWNLSIVLGLFNIVFFFIGLIFIGKKFALNTLASSLLYPVCVAVFELFNFEFFYLNDIWLNVICGGLIIGTGLGIIMKSGASTGGIDVLAILVVRKIKSLSVGTALLILDVVVMLVQLPSAGLEKFIFGAILAIAYSFAIDKVMMSGKNRVQILINSVKREEIQNLIIQKLDRGVTLLHGQTGYLKHDVDLILTVVDFRELALAKSYIYSVDPHAFIIVSKVSEVSGKGFSIDKVQRKDFTDTRNVLFIGDSKASIEFTGSMLDDVFANFNVKLLRDTIPGATLVPYDTIGVTEHINKRLYETMANQVDQVDYIVIQRSCNDVFYSQFPETKIRLGNPESTNPNESYGAIKYAIDYFTKLCPKAEIIFTTATYRFDVSDGMLDEYNKNLKEIAYKYPNVRVFDLDLVCGVNKNNYKEFYIDGVHQNAEGVELWKNCYIKFFETFLK